jgi:hypothetical protein
MTYAERLRRRHVTQTLRLSGVLLVMVGLGTALNWPAGGLEGIRASVHARPPLLAECGGARTSPGKSLPVCVTDEALAAR